MKFAHAFIALVAVPLCCSADLVFTVTDNGDSTTSWTVSGSGTTTAELTAGQQTVAQAFNVTSWTSTGTVSTSGAWTLNGRQSDLEQINNNDSGVGTDGMTFTFDSDFSAGESLAGASGTVIFPINFSALSLPTVQDFASTPFGTITITAVPEPTSTALVTLIALGGLAAFRSHHRKKDALSQTAS